MPMGLVINSPKYKISKFVTKILKEKKIHFKNRNYSPTYETIYN